MLVSMQEIEPQSGDVAYFEDCVPGGEPYRVCVSYLFKAKGWHNVATGGRLKDEYVSDKTLILLVRDGRPV